jgi:hypothetical protein
MAQGEAEMLRELEESVLFAPDFPKRLGYNHEQQASLSKEEALRRHEPSLAAIERASDSFGHLGGLARRLGTARYEPAIPTLARIWRECALVPVRINAGHALFAMQTDEARSVLESMIEDSDHLSSFLGVRAVFDRDPDRAFDYFEHRFRQAGAGSSAVARQALGTLAPMGFTSEGGRPVPRWTEPRAPSWLKRDPRWLNLCARLRRDAVFGDVARDVLRHADSDDMRRALNRVRQEEPPRTLDQPVKRVGNLAARYRSGQFDVVWREIRAQGNVAGDLRAEILEVAEETMRRVARNADLLAQQLSAEGWKPLFGRLRTAPSSSDAGVFDRIESVTGGPLPPSLRAFWTVVGGIDWVWNYHSGGTLPSLGVDVPMDEMDPLCVHAAGDIAYLFQEWEEQRRQPDPDLVDPFQLSLAPDYLHKANISGGAPYTIELPFFGADPLFAYERHELPFIDYLRLSFRWAGFPGLDEHGDREDVRRFVSRFGEGLEPF